jgi:RNA polymerase sigma factor (sigma-70 family)
MSELSASQTHASLLARLRENPFDQEAWNHFVDRYGRKIYKWCVHWNLQSADAEDVTQIVLLKLAIKMRTFVYDPARSFRAWLKTVTHHAWRDYVDSRRGAARGAGSHDINALLENQALPDDLDYFLEEEHQRTLLEEAMALVQARVEPKTWQAFHFQALEQKSGSEAAEQVGLSIAAAFMAKSRVQTMLRQETARLQRDG